MPPENTQLIDETSQVAARIEPTKLEIALNFLAKGYRPIPLGGYQEMPPAYFIECHGGDIAMANEKWPKTPRIKWAKYQKQAPIESEVRHWWARNPDANIGIITGDPIVVVDADTPEAVKWCVENLPQTQQVMTGNGRHFYFYSGITKIRNSAGGGLDVRGEGGYIVAPGSTHPNGKVYQLLAPGGNTADFPNELPELTVEHLQLIEQFRNPAAAASVNSTGGQVFANLRAIKDPPGTPQKEGGRNNACASEAGRWFQLGHSDQEVFEFCMAWNEGNMPPLSPEEVSKTVKSIGRKHRREAVKRRQEAVETSVIRVMPGNLHEVVDSAEMILGKTGEVYNAGGQIVLVSRDNITEQVKMKPLNRNNLTDFLSRYAEFNKVSKVGKLSKIDPPDRHVCVLADRQEFISLRPLVGVSSQPYIKENGELCSTTGYDPDSRIYADFDAGKYSLNSSPTMEDARAALARIVALFTEFEFQDEHDLSAAVSACLTAATRKSLPTAPMIHVEAHMSGSGKTFLNSLIKQFASPVEAPGSSLPKSNEECEKKLLSELIRSPAVIEYDNLAGTLAAHESLCTVLTSPAYSGRILGQSKIIEVSTRSLFLSSGNNVSAIDDMVRRVMPIKLNPKSEKPEQREFSKDPVAMVKANREAYISDCLTITRAYFTAGRPKVNVKSMNGFNQWSGCCRLPLVWLGMQDPAKGMLLALEDNPGRALFSAIIEQLHRRFQSRVFTVKLIHAELRFTPELEELLFEAAPDKYGETVDKSGLGRWLSSKVGHKAEGKCLQSRGVKPQEYLISVTKPEPPPYMPPAVNE